jgi:acyl-CoA reductase-like NAD-dependent aldehyde dehydrogenase
MPTTVMTRIDSEDTDNQRDFTQDNPESLKHRASESQKRWAEKAISDRLTVLKAARHRLAAMTQDLAAAISQEYARTAADTLVAEILPLLAAGRFLEQQAEKARSDEFRSDSC